MTDHSSTSDTDTTNPSQALPSGVTSDTTPSTHMDLDRVRNAAQAYFDCVREELRRLGKHAIISAADSAGFIQSQTLTLGTDTGRLTFTYDKSREIITEVTFSPDGLPSTGFPDGSPNPIHIPVTVNADIWSWDMIRSDLTVAEYLDACRELPTAIEQAWVQTDTNVPVSNILADGWDTELYDLHDAWQDEVALNRTTTTVDDLVTALTNREYKYVEHLFNVDTPIPQQDGTELARLCDQPVNTIPYKDEDIALIYPEPAANQLNDLLSISQADDLRRVDFSGISGAHDRFSDSPFYQDVLEQRSLHEAYVVGTDDTPTGFFVHPIDVTDIDPDADLTRKQVHRLMGFDRNVDPTNGLLDTTRGTRVRLQGDLRISRVDNVHHALETLGDDQQDIEPFLRAAIQQWIEQQGGDADTVNILVAPDSHEVPDATHYNVTLAVPTNVELFETITTCTRVLDLSADLGNALLETVDASQRATHANRAEYAEALLTLLENRVKAELEDLYQLAIDKRDQYPSEQRQQTVNAGQCNIPIDNHTVILQSGRVPPSETRAEEPILVIVPETTYLHVVHDEHEQLDIELAQGVYELSLLPRGILPTEERVRMRMDALG